VRREANDPRGAQVTLGQLLLAVDLGDVSLSRQEYIANSYANREALKNWP
jgi:hypothetical protein